MKILVEVIKSEEEMKNLVLDHSDTIIWTSVEVDIAVLYSEYSTIANVNNPVRLPSLRPILS